MTAPGTPFESPRACPFVALEQDRDRRSDKPDYNHRCFAEPTPAPRSIAHQEAYCLSPSFSSCPVFQDWAVRAAARPLEGSGSGSSATASDAALAEAAAASAAAVAGAQQPDVDHDLDDVRSETSEQPQPSESVFEELPEDASVTAAGAEIAAAAAATTGISPGVSAPPTFATTDWQSEAHESEQLSAFDAQSAGAAEAQAPAFNPAWYSQTDDPPHSSHGEPDAGDAGAAAAAQAPEAPGSAQFVPPPTRPQPAQPAAAPADEAAAAAAVPAFLAGRSSRPPTTTPPAREDIVPSWDIDNRYGAAAPPPPSSEGGGSRLDGVLTAIAVVAILALGVAAVIFLPGLLNKGSAPRTPLPSIVIASGVPTSVPSGVSTSPPSVPPSIGPSVAPTEQASQGPESSPHLYKIKAGDSLAKIANKFGVSVQDILDANPDISNPNNIFVGQIIVIPDQAPEAT
ncbi:MAG TPA: LysM peptidoglycan-binding domain-containing protein [Candidatus Limnocylindrales bacterium]|jgi:LysM repeat protein